MSPTKRTLTGWEGFRRSHPSFMFSPMLPELHEGRSLTVVLPRVKDWDCGGTSDTLRNAFRLIPDSHA